MREAVVKIKLSGEIEFYRDELEADEDYWENLKEGELSLEDYLIDRALGMVRDKPLRHLNAEVIFSEDLK